MATQECVERIAKTFLGKNDVNDELDKLIELQEIIEPHDITEAQENDILSFLFGAIKRRDSELMRMLADEMYAPESQLNNPKWQAKMGEIADGTFKPSLTLID